MPTYREIADTIAARIRDGEDGWRPGQWIPTTLDIAAEQQVSEATAYRALMLLVDRRLIIGQAPVGRFVAGADPDPLPPLA